MNIRNEAAETGGAADKNMKPSDYPAGAAAPPRLASQN